MLRAKKLKGASIIRAAAAHNKRAIQAEVGASASIDAARSHLNECLAGPATPDEVFARAQTLMKAAGITKLRKDAVRAVEIVVSLHPAHGTDEHSFFAGCVAWAAGRFGGADNILSADVHRDEAAPHLHLLMLPLIGGRMVGSDQVGGPKQLAELQQHFHSQCAAPYGFKRQQPRMHRAARATGAAAVVAHLKQTRDAVLRSPLMGGRCASGIETNPAPFLEALNLEAPAPRAKKLRSMTSIFISKGKGSAIADADEAYRV